MEMLLARCEAMPGAVEGHPFGPGVTVFKVAGKVFATFATTEQAHLTLKCDPHLALALRAEHPAVKPGYHTNKRHWNTIEVDGSIHVAELLELVDHSYELVVDRLTTAQRATLQPR